MGSRRPCQGKRPSISGWQHKTMPVRAEMRTWSGANTGALTAYTPAIDIDVTNPAAAELAEDVAKELFGDRGKIPVRFGRLPKRALLFSAATPFPKMSASYEAPSGTTHKIEILGDGQQIVCFGTHPERRAVHLARWHAPGHAARGARRDRRGGRASFSRARQ